MGRCPYIGDGLFGLGNRYAQAQSDPTASISARVVRLIGKTGLDPLDPVSPLSHVSMHQVERGKDKVHQAVVATEFHYVDGTSRRYPVWVWQRDTGSGAIAGWRYSHLERAVTPHDRLIGVAPATSSSPIQLATPQPLAADDPRLQALGETTVSVRVRQPGPRWLPDFAPRRPSVRLERAISPDGQLKVVDCRGLLCIEGNGVTNAVAVSDPPQPTPPPGFAAPRPPSFQAAWREDSQAVAAIRGSYLVPDYAASVQPDWHHTTVAPNRGQVQAAKLLILDRAGQVLTETFVGPAGATWPPQWSQDGRFIHVTTFPMDGRRLIAVEVATGRVFDLGRESWDAYGWLVPGTNELLVWHDWGDPWVVQVLYP